MRSTNYFTAQVYWIIKALRPRQTISDCPPTLRSNKFVVTVISSSRILVEVTSAFQMYPVIFIPHYGPARLRSACLGVSVYACVRVVVHTNVECVCVYVNV